MDPRSLRPRLPDATARVLAATSRGPVARAAARVLVAGEEPADAARVTATLHERGHRVSWLPLWRPATSPDDIISAAQASTEALTLLGGLGGEMPGLAPDLTLDVAAFGVLAPDVTPGILLSALREVGQASRNAGVTLTLTIRDARLIEAVQVLGDELRQDFPEVGIVWPTRLRQAPGDVHDLATPGRRVRLTTERLDAAIGMTSARESGNAFVDLAKLLLEGGAHVEFDTDVALLVDLARSLVQQHGADAELVAPLGTQQASPNVAQPSSALPSRVVVPFGPQQTAYVADLFAARPSVAVSLATVLRRKG